MIFKITKNCFILAWLFVFIILYVEKLKTVICPRKSAIFITSQLQISFFQGPLYALCQECKRWWHVFCKRGYLQYSWRGYMLSPITYTGTIKDWQPGRRWSWVRGAWLQVCQESSQSRMEELWSLRVSDKFSPNHWMCSE